MCLQARAEINFKKQNRSSDYKFRVVKEGQKVKIRYDHTHTGTTKDGFIISDLGENHSTVMVKIIRKDKKTYDIRIHKSDILIEKTDPNYSEIFSDLPQSILPNTTTGLTD